jgi:Uma2 family endonuclease
MTAIPLQQDNVFYPESDGKPMGETQLHASEIMYLIQALWERYQDTPDVYVWGDLFLYYVEGDPSSSVVPDVFLVKGVPKQPARRIYKLWEEGKSPCLVIEVTSESTRRVDQRRKRDLYERLGVEEYFLHDPYAEWLRPALQGYRLSGGKYQPIEPEPDGSLISRTTGLRLRREGERLRLIDLATGEPLLSATETAEALRRVEEELTRLQREIDRQKS